MPYLPLIDAKYDGLYKTWKCLARGTNHALFNDSVSSSEEDVTRKWRQLHNEENRNLYSSPIIIIVIKVIKSTGDEMYEIFSAHDSDDKNVK
jgi:hypothetical protein